MQQICAKCQLPTDAAKMHGALCFACTPAPAAVVTESMIAAADFDALRGLATAMNVADQPAEPPVAQVRDHLLRYELRDYLILCSRSEETTTEAAPRATPR